MAAGLGFKDFTTGEVLTAADVDGYLMQGVWVFASAAARDAAVTSPQEGNFAYLKDTNVTTYYTGSAWANLDTTGMTNPMTTTGDTIYSSSGSTPARLGIGTAGQVLRVNSGATAPEWATPAVPSSGLTLIANTAFSAVSSQSFNDVFSSTYTNYRLILEVRGSTAAQTQMRMRVGGSDNTSGNYSASQLNPGQSFGAVSTGNEWQVLRTDNGEGGVAVIELGNPFATQKTTYANLSSGSDGSANPSLIIGQMTVTTSYTGFSVFPQSGTITGKALIYGYSL